MCLFYSIPILRKLLKIKNKQKTIFMMKTKTLGSMKKKSLLPILDIPIYNYSI